MIVTLHLFNNKKGFKNLPQTNILYFVLKPFYKKNDFTLTQALKSSSLKIKLKLTDHNLKMLQLL